ncbi:2-dehydropantoate 2-reductase (Ketopantoate reductase) (KPA reductase) (KPR) [Tieghemiomyces parasiticus]|uniref:2-dehydropantoate 2-reductase n=1 Tax=Tieghemiomyces parasiticus TaxID=78921 RepID=A0A9W7ZNZ6_9FUNG|nr:2-dehydropantoate 2-reductase (Ketopantoate reductase) (KPA reductase) (KPR) [Tieghemiomyces parasiticus]
MTHVLGVGAIGTLVAFHLKRAYPGSPVTLLLRNQAARRSWIEKAGERLTIRPLRPGLHEPTPPKDTSATGCTGTQGGFQYEVLDHMTDPGPIRRLIITTKAHQTVDAYAQLIPRLGPSSVVVLLQNGIGVQEGILSRHYPSRGGSLNTEIPHFVLGTTNHGCYREAPFRIVHAGLGEISLGSQAPAAPEVQATLETLPGVDGLNVHTESWPALSRRLLVKLAVNGFINALTALFDCPNGDLVTHSRYRALLDFFCRETSAILTKHVEAQGCGTATHCASTTDELARSLTPEALRTAILHTCRLTAANESSMRQDYRAGRQTEIDYINGYLTRLATRYGLPGPYNQLVTRLIADRVGHPGRQLLSLAQGSDGQGAP